MSAKTKTKADDEVFRLTAKGMLCMLVDDGRGGEEVWQRLRDFVELTALRDGHKRGVPALVFDDGGVCVTMEKAP